MRPTPRWRLSFALVLCLLLSACQEEGSTGKDLVVVPVTVANATKKDVDITREWVGTLDGMVNAQIRPQVTGYLKKRLFEEGQYVTEGQVLYEIDSRTFKAKLDGEMSVLAREEASLRTAKLDYDRIQRLLPEQAVSVRDRDNALGRVNTGEAQVLVAKSAVERARLDVSFTQIRAPISGIIGLSMAQIGDLVGPNTTSSGPLTTVSQVDPIRAYISISEKDYLHFANGIGIGPSDPTLELVLADGSIYPHKGRFYVADRQVDPATGTLRVATLFKNPGNLLRPGQFTRVRAILEVKKDAVLIPQRSVTELQGTAMVAVLKPDDTVDLRKVKMAERIGELWVVESGIQPGDRVVYEGVQKVRQGIKVRPQPVDGVTSDSSSPR